MDGDLVGLGQGGTSGIRVYEVVGGDTLDEGSTEDAGKELILTEFVSGSRLMRVEPSTLWFDGERDFGSVLALAALLPSLALPDVSACSC